MLKNVLLLFLLFLLGAFIKVNAQDSLLVYDKSPVEVKSIAPDLLEDFKNDPDLNYEVTVESKDNFFQQIKNWLYFVLLRLLENIFGVEEAVGIFAFILKTIPYLLIALLVYFLVKFFVKNRIGGVFYGKKNIPVVTLSEEEDIIKNSNIKELIDKAISEKNYRLAVRYYYLLILQLLSDKDFIVWELQKTNHDYLRELSNSKLTGHFSDITRLYDYIWYGEFEIDHSKYLKVEAFFSNMKSEISNA